MVFKPIGKTRPAKKSVWKEEEGGILHLEDKEAGKTAKDTRGGGG